MNNLKKDKYRILIAALSILSIIYTYFYYHNVFEEFKPGVLINFLACVLFIAYVLVLYTKQKAAIIIPIILGMMVLAPFNQYKIFDLNYILLVVFCVVSIINVLKGNPSKTFIIIAMAIFYYGTISYDEYNMLDGMQGLSIAIILYVLKYDIPAILQKPLQEMSAEQELGMLKTKLELKLISEEEYQEQRAKIINNI